jgi:hypothetical protein
MKSTRLLLLIASLPFPMVSQAALLTTNTLTGASSVDFSQFVGSGLRNVGPQQIGQLAGEDIVASGGPNNTSSLYLDGRWGHGNNGRWDHIDMDGFLGYNRGIGALIITFNDGPVAVRRARLADAPQGLKPAQARPGPPRVWNLSTEAAARR